MGMKKKLLLFAYVKKDTYGGIEDERRIKII